MAAYDRLERYAGYLFALFILVLTMGIIVGGFFYYRSYQTQYRAQVEIKLSAIADLKVKELVRWRNERLGDGSLFYDNPNFTDWVSQYLNNPGDASVREILLTWISKVQAAYVYNRIFLVDAQGTMRLAVPDSPEPVPAHLLEQMPSILNSDRPTFLDFHRDGPGAPIHLSVLVPIREPLPGGKPLGVLVLRIDPATYLYPFINRWPAPSETAETLIVRRDVNDALFLNELRFNKNAALTLRIPLERTNTPAVAAVLGQEGLMEGIDYRGVPVVAVTRSIPDSPWFLVARMDRSEIYAPILQRLWLVIALGSILIFGAISGLGMLWRQQRLHFYKKQYEVAEALRTISAHQDALLAAMPDIVMEVDKNKVYTWANQRGFEFFGEDVIGKEAAVYFEGDLDVYKVVQPLFDGDEEIIYLENWQRRKDGEKRLLAWWCKAVKDSNGNVAGLVSSARDITESRQAEERLHAALADLERSNRELEQFAYVASHDLQEPLRMVASYTQLLARHYEGQMDEKAKKYIDYAVDGAVRMQNLINDLLAYSRVGTRGASFKLVDSHAALGLALANLQGAIQESGAIVTNDNLPKVYGDHAQLAQLFQNLIGNAIKFRGAKTPHIHISATLHEGFAEFCVRDNGIGIDPKHADRVFQLFQRLHTRAEYPGTGIGLALCKRIVDQHGGKIWLDSKLGKGAHFYFTISTEKSKDHVV